MALRPGRTVRKIERPYTRVSKKVPRKSYAVGVPLPKIHQFEMGNREGNFNIALYLISKRAVQIRHNALEAARIVAHKFLEKKVGPSNYFLKFLVYPHHVLREKPVATGAGADRFSQGMRLSFGKPVGVACQIRGNQRIVMLKINKENLEIGKQALKRLSSKLPTHTFIEVEEF
ncbi:MAG: 50S ribosomal protein L16 [Candidatus Aenigmatarchaeota archaeon]